GIAGVDPGLAAIDLGPVQESEEQANDGEEQADAEQPGGDVGAEKAEDPGEERVAAALAAATEPGLVVAGLLNGAFAGRRGRGLGAFQAGGRHQQRPAAVLADESA